MDVSKLETQVYLLQELLEVMDEAMLAQLDMESQRKILEILMKYDPIEEGVDNERLH
jgi:hypothetical protein